MLSVRLDTALVIVAIDLDSAAVAGGLAIASSIICRATDGALPSVSDFALTTTGSGVDVLVASSDDVDGVSSSDSSESAASGLATSSNERSQECCKHSETDSRSLKSNRVALVYTYLVKWIFYVALRHIYNTGCNKLYIICGLWLKCDFWELRFCRLANLERGTTHTHTLVTFLQRKHPPRALVCKIVTKKDDHKRVE